MLFPLQVLIIRAASLFPNKISKNNSPGFTLVEVVIALVIIAILSAVGTSSVIARLPQIRLRKAVRELISNMQQAKFNAIKYNAPWRIVFNNNGYKMVSSGKDRTFGTADDVVVKTVTLADYGSGVQYGAGHANMNWNNNALPAIPPNTPLSFNSLGTTNLVTVYLTNKDKAVCYAITTNLAGGNKLYYYSGAAPFNKVFWSEN